MLKDRVLPTLLLTFSLTQLIGCGSDSSSYSILPEGETFYQSASEVNSKIDILWVIDNSGSMSTSQTNLTENFSSFISGFSTRNYDFKMAVGTTDAFLALPMFATFYQSYANQYYFNRPQSRIAQFRDSNPPGSSGVYVLTPLTAALNTAFNQRALVGTNGYGDERAIQSLRTILESSHNTGFHRSDAFLAVILITDEDDFSHSGTQPISNVADPSLHPISSYVTFLDQFTGTTGVGRRYSVSTISVKDNACRNALSGGVRKIGVRVAQLAEQTGGVVGDICGDFSSELQLISDRILSLSTQFFLSRKPLPDTIRVNIDGVSVPRADNSPSGGWTYNPESISLIFSGTYIPNEGAQINVSFDPDGLQF